MVIAMTRRIVSVAAWGFGGLYAGALISNLSGENEFLGPLLALFGLLILGYLARIAVAKSTSPLRIRATSVPGIAAATRTSASETGQLTA